MLTQRTIILSALWMLTLLGSGLAGGKLQAQQRPTAREEIKANRYLAGSNYLDYDRAYGRDALTPAPRGYEPFYMSHYGRHGSRWLLSDGDYLTAIRPLRKAREQGKLSAKGLEVLNQLEQFFLGTRGRLGDLTTVGERQHHGIGRRMVEHFPEIFMKKGVKIDARSTVVIRCILSMTAECEELSSANPTARIHNDVSEALQWYLNAPWRGEVRRQSGKGRAVEDEYRERWTHPERLCSVMFTDPQWVQDSIDAGSFMRHLFEVAANMQSHDAELDAAAHIDSHAGEVGDLLSLFTDEEIYDQWRRVNLGWYQNYGPSPATGSVMPFSQRHLLKNIIETTDTVTQVQATLRFGHEVCVMPLACLLELGNCGFASDDWERLDDTWRNYEIFPMACNVQLIFYRPKKGKSGDVLVKALLNEREVSLPVATDRYPYYRWTDLRQYYLDKLQRFDELERASIESTNV